MLRALLIRHPHIDKILDGKKIWEIRGSRTNIRGPIALIASRSGAVIGVCELIDCVGPLTANTFRKNAAKAGMRPSEAKLGGYRQTYAWVLAKPNYLKKPVAYKHPPGAIIWVTLDRRVERKILDQIQSPPKREVPTRNADSFLIGEIVSMENADPGWEDEPLFGIVVRKEKNRMKLVWACDVGETYVSWLTRDDERVQNRWIDNTLRRFVRVEEATVSQREAFQRWVPLDRQSLLVGRERQRQEQPR